MTTHWVCVAHRFLVPPVACSERGEGDGSAARHTEKEPKHPTLTTTNLALADRLALPADACPGCGRSWDRDLEPSGGRSCPDCTRTADREAAL